MKPIAKLLSVTAALSLAAAVLVQPAVAAEAAKVAAPDVAKGDASYNAVCAACHGTGGNSTTPANPKLAGQHAAYIAKQLTEYKSGKRANAIMSGMAAALSEDDMKNIAAYVGAKKAQTNFAKDKDLVVLGERIFRGGIADRQVPACSGCHAPNGAGIPSQYPRLAGQHADYTAAQLTAFRDGVRKNNAQMTGVSAKMNDREIKAVSDYIAGLR